MTFDEAVDEMLGVFTAAWTPTGFPVVWTDVPGNPPTTETPWARVTVKHATGRQGSLAGEVGTRIFDRTGTIFIQVFTPVGQSMSESYRLAQLLVNAYEDARLEVWFRNTRMKEVGASGAFEQVNVLSDFLYDDVR